MPSFVDIAVGLFLAYYWTGCEMVVFHSHLPPEDRPGYVRNPAWQRVISGAAWPLVTYWNRELAWFGVCFLSAATVYSFAHSALLPYVGSTALFVLILAVVRIIPVVAAILNFPLALLGATLWFLIAEPLGGKPPFGMNRFLQK